MFPRTHVWYLCAFGTLTLLIPFFVPQTSGGELKNHLVTRPVISPPLLPCPPIMETTPLRATAALLILLFFLSTVLLDVSWGSFWAERQKVSSGPRVSDTPLSFGSDTSFFYGKYSDSIFGETIRNTLQISILHIYVHTTTTPEKRKD